MNYLEIVAAAFGFLSVVFYMMRSMWAWPTGLIQVILLIGVFWKVKLYADMVLHIVYVALQLYGWRVWWTLKRTLNEPEKMGTSTLSLADREAIPIRSMSLRGHSVGLAVTIALTALFASNLYFWTDAAQPLADSFVAAASLVAQYLLAARFLQTWGYWIAVDVVGIGLFAYKGLYPTAILYVLFGGLSLFGWMAWRRAYRLSQSYAKPLP